MLKRRAVHKDMAEANVYAARRLKDMAQSLGGAGKDLRAVPGGSRASREDGIAAWRRRRPWYAERASPAGSSGNAGGAGMMRIIICIIFCGPLKKGLCGI